MRFCFVTLLSLCLMACATSLPSGRARANLQDDLDQGLVSENSADTIMISNEPTTDAAGFSSWVAGFTARAIAVGADPVTTQRVMASVRFQPKIITLDQKQPETQLTLQQYLDKTVSPDKVSQGRAQYAANATLLEQIARQTGVPAQIIVALWGKESDYGRFTGGYAIGDALATLAYEGRRRELFETELLQFIRITQTLNRDPTSLKGSWAGAMGQCQFMPSSYLTHAVDGDGDGLADIWNSLPDVFASTANLLLADGWQAGQPVAVPVTLPATLDPLLVGRDKAPHSVNQWMQQGVQLHIRWELPAGIPARIYAPDGMNGPAFMIFPNFDVVIRWNSSGYFATGVALLANRVASVEN